MRIPAHFVAICLAVVLAFTGQSMAAARGAPDVAGKMTLCIGTASVVVYMDEHGAPTQAPHYCPDCTLSLLDVLPSVLTATPERLVTMPYISMRYIADQSDITTNVYLSRAPPMAI